MSHSQSRRAQLEGPGYEVRAPAEPPKRFSDLDQALDAVIRLLPPSDAGGAGRI